MRTRRAVKSTRLSGYSTACKSTHVWLGKDFIATGSVVGARHCRRVTRHFKVNREGRVTRF